MFAGFLRQSTATTITLGVFVDASAAATPETASAGLTPTISKNGGTSESAANAIAHMASGVYSLVLDTADVDTVGRLSIWAGSDGAVRYIKQEYQVITANVYDALFGSSAALGTDIASMLEDTATTIPASLTSITGLVATTAGAVTSSIPATLIGIGADTDTIIAGISSYEKDDVNEKRTWPFTKATSSTRSPHIIEERSEFDGTLKFNLTNQLNDGAGVLAITSVTVTPAGPTITGPGDNANPVKTSDNKCVLFDIDGSQDDGVDYVFTCNVTTTDGDGALVVSGLMKCRDE